ncbi:MAG: YihY/virulence factor BrkB family protein [Acidobacteria bacterium]|nr:MAG: YihY/virulence factor BrkB family protein [Acidobacteriota bacterium]
MSLPWQERDLIAELKETWRITRLSAWRAVIEFYEADDLTYAASIAYYALLSMFPFALIIVSILGSVTADEDTRQKVLMFVLRYFPGQFDFITMQLDAFRQNPIRLGVGSGILLVWGALGVFGAISTAVNHAWGVEKTRSFWGHRVFSFLMLLTAGLMLMIGLLGATAAQIISARWFAGVSENFPALRIMQGYLIRNVLLFLPAFVFGLIYYFVPNVKVLVKDVWLGALITGLLWDACFTGFSWFIRDVSRFSRIHGSIATVIVFLIWVYSSAVILLWGVEFTASYSKMRRDMRAAGAESNG